MILKRLHLEGFRNIAQMDLVLGERFNYLHGANGAGKTAVLEGLAFLARGRSFRSARSVALINHQSDTCLVRAELLDGEQLHRVGIQRSHKAGIEVSVDGERSARVSELARLLPVQVLLPNAADLVYGAPSVRREFLDWGLFHVEQGFLETARRYRRTLQQRNAWLKNAESGVLAASDPWMTQYAALGTQMNEVRARYVVALESVFQDVLRRLAPELSATLAYHPGNWPETGDDLEETGKKLGESFARDVKFGVSHRGPHRADLLIDLGGATAADTASRGQAKVIASAAYLAQAVLQERLTNVRSVFLIDDFGAELDEEHWRRFHEQLVDLGCQVIVTSTERPSERGLWRGGAGCELFHVKQGELALGQEPQDPV